MGCWGHVTPLQEAIDRLRLEVEELRASRKRLVAAADADRRRIERELHEGVQQHLVALAVNLQLLGQLADSDPPAAKTLLDEMARDVQVALDEAAQLAQADLPAAPRLGRPRGRLARGGEAGLGRPHAGASYPPGVSAAVYWCCIEALEQRRRRRTGDDHGARAGRSDRLRGRPGERPPGCGARPAARPRRGARRNADDRVGARPRHERLRPAPAPTLARSRPGRGRRP